MRNYTKIGIVFFAAVFLLSCRKDKEPFKEFTPSTSGLYLLNEGNMGSNKATLDFYNLETGVYQQDIFSAANPTIELGLGDVGNDIKIYGSKMYIVVNGSNKVEVLDIKNSKRLGKIDINNCRYVAFYKNKAFVTSYDGFVAVIDTTEITRVQKTISVGRQPEEMAVVGDKLYVANSGGYKVPDNEYDRTVSVIDLISETEVKKIDVGINLHKLKADQYGDLYVTSRGDYLGEESSLYLIDTKTDVVKKHFNLPVTNLYIHGDIAYMLSYSYITNAATYLKLDIKNEVLLNEKLIKDGTEAEIKVPYGIAIDPSTGNIYVTDAKDNLSPGTLYIYNSQGNRINSFQTGDIPAHFAFK